MTPTYTSERNLVLCDGRLVAAVDYNFRCNIATSDPLAARIAACLTACADVRDPAAVPALFAAVRQWKASETSDEDDNALCAINAALALADGEAVA